MPTISIEVKGTEQVINKFNRLNSKLKDLTPEFRELGEYLTKYYSGEAFLSEGQVFGKAWPALKSSTLSVKTKKFPGRQPLVATGKMQRSFVSDANANQLVVKNTAPYFKYHQSAQPRTRLPRRVMIGVNNTIAREVKEVVYKGIQRILNG